jgi:hypothetical protein
LTLQQSQKHPGLVRRFLHGHQVLNLTEGHHPLDAILWAPVLDYRKLSGVLGALSWVVWIDEKLQIDPIRLVRVRRQAHQPYPSSSPWKQKEWGGELSLTEGGKAAEDLKSLLISIFWIEIMQQECDHSALC